MTDRGTHIVRKALAALITACSLLAVSTAMAARLDFIPSLTLDQTYDSNVFNTNGNEKGDFVLRATPGVTFSLRMPETTLNLRSSITSDTYYKYTDRSSSSSALSLALDSATPIAVTSRLSIAPSAHFVQAQDSYRRTQLLPTGDPLVPTAIATESGLQKSRDYGGGLRIAYLVTPKIEAAIGGNFTKRDFLDNTTGEYDSRVFTGDTTLSYRFTERLSSGFFANTSYNTFENGRDSRTYAGGLTASYRFSPAYSVDARAGASRAQESEPGTLERVTWSPYGSLTLAYTQRDFRASLSGIVNQSGGGSLGYTTQTESVNLTISDQFATRWWGDISGSYQKSKSLDPANSEDLESATGTAGIRYQPWEWATLHLSGTALQQWSHGTVGTDLKRYSALLGFTLGYTHNLY